MHILDKTAGMIIILIVSHQLKNGEKDKDKAVLWSSPILFSKGKRYF